MVFLYSKKLFQTILVMSWFFEELLLENDDNKVSF